MRLDRAFGRYVLGLGAAVLLASQPLAASAQVGATPLQTLLNQLNANRSVAREGQSTQAEGGPTAQAAVGQTAPPAERLEPFGAKLFAGGGAAQSDAVNPDYIVQPGDRIGIGVLGAEMALPTDPTGAGAAASAGSSVQATVPVDPQGNIFLPEVGAVHVGGVKASALQTTIQAAASRTFTSNVKFYAVLLTTHRIGVFVTGFVARPGRYAGAAADTALDYLSRAGGVDPSRGSYRDITVSRDGAVVGRIDLYDFLLTGRMPGVTLREGDTVFVGRQNAMVAVDGAVRNNYLFELPSAEARGQEIVELARPLPSATHAVLVGTRNKLPFTQYLDVAGLAAARIVDQDRVTFVTDAAAKTVRVRIEGSRIGPSVLVVPTDSRLPDAVKLVQVDPALADVKSVYVLRRSIAEQQSRVIQEARDRLERSLFLAVSPTAGVSAIRASEAQLVATYIARARNVQPDGRLVVADDNGNLADLRLNDDDIIVIPEKSQVVLVSGEVLAPQAVLFRPGARSIDYVRLAGGYSERGRNGHFLVKRANGAVLLDQDVELRAGDELVVLPYIDPKRFQLGADLLSLVYQAAVAANVFRAF